MTRMRVSVCVCNRGNPEWDVLRWDKIQEHWKHLSLCGPQTRSRSVACLSASKVILNSLFSTTNDIFFFLSFWSQCLFSQTSRSFTMCMCDFCTFTSCDKHTHTHTHNDPQPMMCTVMALWLHHGLQVCILPRAAAHVLRLPTSRLHLGSAVLFQTTRHFHTPTH